MARYIPECGDKFKVFAKVKIIAYEGDTFICTPGGSKGTYPLIKAKREGEDEPDYDFDRNLFVFERVD